MKRYLLALFALIATPAFAGPPAPVLPSLSPYGDASNTTTTATASTTPRTQANRAADVYNVLDYGAKGDCVTDDSAAIQSVINKVTSAPTNGIGVFFPKPPGACYLVNTALSLPGGSGTPDGYNVEMFGNGRDTVTIKAGASLRAVIRIAPDGAFNRGHAVHDLTVNANALATYGIELDDAMEARVYKNKVLNALTTDIIVGSPGISGSSATQGEDFIDQNFVWNQTTVFTTPASLPPYGIQVLSADNHINENIIFNAKTASIDDEGADNHYIQNHGYSYPKSSPLNPSYDPTQAYTTQNIFLANGNSFWIGNTADTGALCGFQLGNFGNIVEGNQILWAKDGGGYTLATNGTAGICMPGSLTNTVVTGNFIWAPYSAADAVFVGTISGTTFTPQLPGVNVEVSGNVGSNYSWHQNGVWSGFNQSPLAGGPNAGVSLGYIGNSGNLNGTGTFGFGNVVDDYYRNGCMVYASGSGGSVAFPNFAGASQVVECTMRGAQTAGSSTPIDILALGSTTRNKNEISLRNTYHATELVHADIVASCISGDAAGWTVDFVLTNGTSGGNGTTVFASGSAPTPTLISRTSGASGWAPSVVLDTTNGGAVIQGAGTCTSGTSKVITWTASVKTTETYNPS